jgi:hypothetical protein
MKVLAASRSLAETNGWSLAYAQGYVDGELHCRRGDPPGTYPRVGFDEYSLGFRAAYFERRNTASRSGVPSEGAAAQDDRQHQRAA